METIKMYGWTGKRLKVDLSRNKYVKEDLNSDLLKGYLGGRGFNIRLLYDLTSPNLNPLAPENPLI